MKRTLTSLTAAVSFAFMANALTPSDILGDIVRSSVLESEYYAIEAEYAGQRADNFVAGPELEFEHLWSRHGETKWALGVSQRFDWPGAYGAKRRTLESERRANILRLEALALNTRLEAMTAMVRLRYNRMRSNVLDGMIDDLTSLNANLDTALTYGLVTILDKKKAELEIAALCVEKSRLAAEKDELLGSLVVMCGKNIDFDGIDWLDLPLPISIAPYETYVAQLASDPEVMAMKAQAESARAGIDYARAAALPSFAVGYRHEKEEGEHFNGFSVAVELPRWNIAASRKAADAMVAAVTKKNSVSEDLLALRLKNEYGRAVRLRDDIALLRAKGLDGSYLALLREAFEGGELSMLDYLRELAYYRESGMNLLEFEERYTLLLASLNRYF